MSERFKEKFAFTGMSLMATGVFDAVNTFDIHAGHRLMYIYCDIVEHSAVVIHMLRY